ncbi:disks large-associated protein 2 isoform X2 [Musca autumnalis]|uniref:disks large-associated protein 2 isoform X2 n=1 Tax=Musca autumnalis TaxID=221902 RepID=UPI003CEC44C1
MKSKDTSGSLNFPTPISIKDITREFTANIRERCSVQTVKNNTTAYVDPVTGQVCIALSNNTTTTTQQPTATVNNNINTVVAETHNKRNTAAASANHHLSSSQTPIAADTYDKKPSYLNLACCVNGYSNITTYDSKIRQDINKSREVSPIRPSSTSLQYCKKSNSLAPPVLFAMPNVNVTSPHHHHLPHMATNGGGGAIMTTIGSKYTIIENNNHSQNGGTDSSLHNLSVGDDIGGGGSTVTRSFIQQRVERLYGPGALAQGFYSPKKIRESPQRLNRSLNSENGGGATSELVRKFQELSPSKDYNKFREKLSSNGKPAIPASLSSSAADSLNSENNNIDLPCLRHLSQEFRAQLPIVSPKRNFSRASPARDLTTTTTASANNKTLISQNSTNNSNSTSSSTMTEANQKTQQNYSTSNGTTTTSNSDIITNNTTTNNHHHLHSSPDVLKSQILNSSSTAAGPMGGSDEVDRKVQLDESSTDLLQTPPPLSSSKFVKSSEELLVITPNAHISNIETAASSVEAPTSNGSSVKDAHFFLRQLKSEQNRLLELAAVAEKYMDALASNPDITEDTMGLLRSASGKARLLVSQKMKQFEGLCHNNLNSSPEDQFPTTVDDLQGFWDMVYLQVDHIDAIFKEVEILKANDWKKPANLQSSNSSNVLKTPKPNKTLLKSRTNTPMANGGGAGSGATPSAAALKREAQRKKLQEMKRRNREAMAAAAASPVATTNDDGVALIDGIEILEANNSNKQQTQEQPPAPQELKQDS